MKKINPRSRKDGIVVQEMNGEVLIYDLNTDKAFCLNETSSLVWKACDGTRSIPELSEHLSRVLNSPANEDLIWLALAQLKKDQLLEEIPSEIEGVTGVTRREMIKRAGMGTVIALPIVASFMVPNAVHALSCPTVPDCTACGGTNRATGCLCSAVGTCCSGNCAVTPGVCRDQLYCQP